MIDQEDIDQMLDGLREFPDRLRALIADCSDDDLSRAAAGGGWGPVEIFCHLRDIEELAIARVKRMLAENEPYMPDVDESLWPIERNYVSQNARVALEQFTEHRAEFTRLLSSIDSAAWHRRGYHSERGEQTIMKYTLFISDHDTLHETQLRESLAAC